MNPLKKITLTPKNKNGLLLFFIFFCLGGKSLQAQVQNNGTLFVGDNTTLFLQSGNLAYGTGSARAAGACAGIAFRLDARRADAPVATGL